MKPKRQISDFSKEIFFKMETFAKNPTATNAAVAATMTPFLLLPQIISALFSAAGDKSVHRFRLLQIANYFLSLSLFFLRLFLSLLPSLTPPTPQASSAADGDFDPNNPNNAITLTDVAAPEGDSGIARALSQTLTIMNEIPASSRKYETVRCLAEEIIDKNLEEGFEILREVNRKVLSNAFAKTLSQLETAVLEAERGRISEMSGGGGGGSGNGLMDARLSWVWNAARVVRDGAMSRVGGGSGVEEVVVSRPAGWSAEKFAAEILWLAQKLVECGNGDEAVSRWGSASNLALLALTAESRIQAYLIKVSALLFKEAKQMGKEGRGKEGSTMVMLMSWLPLLCRAGNGTDSPVLSTSERKEQEKVLESIIEMLDQENEQEKVLALWLHHFTSCPSSDWPNLQACYARWCSASRKLLAAEE